MDIKVYFWKTRKIACANTESLFIILTGPCLQGLETLGLNFLIC